MSENPDRGIGSGVGVFTLLIVTIWGAMGNMLKPYESMNLIKAEVMAIKDPGLLEYARNRVWSDWLQMDLACFLFMAILAVLFLYLPRLFQSSKAEDVKIVTFACRLVAILPLFGALVNVLSMFMDFKLMISHLHSLT